MRGILTSVDGYKKFLEELPSWLQPFFAGENFLEAMVYNLAQATVIFVIGWSVVIFLEKRHLKEIAAQEEKLSNIHLNNIKRNHDHTSDGVMVVGSVVIAHDYVRGFLIFWRKLVGGNISYYDRLVVKGRRVAITRLKEEAKIRGMSAVVGVRFCTTSLTNKKRVKGVEVVAYGTAVK